MIKCEPANGGLIRRLCGVRIHALRSVCMYQARQGRLL
jgi:hypothetical protein